MSARRPWLVLLILGISLGCNALLGAFVVTQQLGALLMPATPGGDLVASQPAQAILALIARLPPQDAATLRAAFREHVMELTAARRRLVMVRQQMREELARPQLDRAALEQAVETTAAARRALADLVQQTLLPAVERLSPEGRRMIAAFRLGP